MHFCYGITAYKLLHYLMKFNLEVTKAKEMTTFYTYFPITPCMSKSDTSQVVRLKNA